MLKSKVLTISKKQNTQDVDSSSSESDKESLKISEVTSENNSEWSDSFKWAHISMDNGQHVCYFFHLPKQLVEFLHWKLQVKDLPVANL